MMNSKTEEFNHFIIRTTEINLDIVWIKFSNREINAYREINESSAFILF